MKRRVKSTTLVELLLYLALFGIVFAAIMQFSLSISEANRNAEYRNELDRASIFINEHIEDSFNSFDSIDINNSFFYQNNGKLKLIKGSNSYTYTISSGVLKFNRNGIESPITNPAISMSSLYLERVLGPDLSLIGIRVSITIKSSRNNNISKSTQTYFSLQ